MKTKNLILTILVFLGLGIGHEIQAQQGVPNGLADPAVLGILATEGFIPEGDTTLITLDLFNQGSDPIPAGGATWTVTFPKWVWPDATSIDYGYNSPTHPSIFASSFTLLPDSTTVWEISVVGSGIPGLVSPFQTDQTDFQVTIAIEAITVGGLDYMNYDCTNDPLISGNLSTGDDHADREIGVKPRESRLDPDFNVTYVNEEVSGDLSTNDDLPYGGTFGSPTVVAGNPGPELPTVNKDGTYTFTSPTPGEYNFMVPVCPVGQTTNCPEELLTITVLDKNDPESAPIANTDHGITKEDTPIDIDILDNDAVTNLEGELGAPSITTQPSNGTVVVNPDGTITYTPDAGFTGIDTLKYEVCDTTLSPPKCDDAYVIIDVLPSNIDNRTEATDDYATTDETTPVSGNVLDNDTDPEGDNQTVVAQNVSNDHGTLVLNTDGTWTFTPNYGVTGPVEFPYTLCDDGTPVECADATLHILVSPVNRLDPDFNITFVNDTVTGDLSTNDDLPQGGTYGTPTPVAGNPGSEVPTIDLDGTYSFVSPTAGEYNFMVPVCPEGQTTDCPEELLTITVLDPADETSAPIANTDHSVTDKDTPIDIDILDNDAATNPDGQLGAPTITSQPNNGSVTVNPDGTVTYAPDSGFTGLDTFQYEVCDTTLSPPKCDDAYVIVEVKPDGATNTTEASDDFALTDDETPVSGNVLDNDSDPEADNQTVVAQNVTTPEGTLVLNTDGTWTFTPTEGVYGPVEYVYEVCDDGSPVACAEATLHILVEDKKKPDLIPYIELTLNNFNLGQTKNFVVRLSEILGTDTENPIAIRVSVPTGYTLAFDPAATTTAVDIAGTFDVTNTDWTAYPVGTSILNLQGDSTLIVPANDQIYIGFSVTNVSASNVGTNSHANITVKIYDDPNEEYDSNPFNNLHEIVISAN